MVSDGPLKVDVTVGKRATEKLIDAAVDAFSPATETLGLLGDAVRLARIEVAVAISRRAKAIADEQGLTLTAPPLKFLVPFYEKASIEDLEDDTLVEMWARLLASAGSDYDARHLRYTSLLSELSANQARILQGMAQNYGGVIGRDVDADALFYELTESRLVSSMKSITDIKKDKILDAIYDRICLPGISVDVIQIELKSSKESWWANLDEVYSDKISIDFEILKSFGLIDRIGTDWIELKHAAVTVNLFHMTELGYKFWLASCGVTEAE